MKAEIIVFQTESRQTDGRSERKKERKKER